MSMACLLSAQIVTGDQQYKWCKVVGIEPTRNNETSDETDCELGDLPGAVITAKVRALQFTYNCAHN